MWNSFQSRSLNYLLVLSLLTCLSVFLLYPKRDELRQQLGKAVLSAGSQVKGIRARADKGDRNRWFGSGVGKKVSWGVSEKGFGIVGEGSFKKERAREPSGRNFGKEGGKAKESKEHHSPKAGNDVDAATTAGSKSNNLSRDTKDASGAALDTTNGQNATSVPRNSAVAAPESEEIRTAQQAWTSNRPSEGKNSSMDRNDGTRDKDKVAKDDSTMTKERMRVEPVSGAQPAGHWKNFQAMPHNDDQTKTTAVANTDKSDVSGRAQAADTNSAANVIPPQEHPGCPGFSPTLTSDKVFSSVNEYVKASVKAGTQWAFDLSLFQNEGLLRLKNAYIVSANPAILIRTCQATLYIGGCANEVNQTVPAIPSNIDSDGVVTVESGIFLSQPYSNSYYHWLAESSTRLALAMGFLRKEWQQGRGNQWKLIHKKGYHEYDKLFHLFGFDDNAIIHHFIPRSYYVKDLVVPRNADCGDPEAKTLKLFREFIKDKGEMMLPLPEYRGPKKKWTRQIKIVVQSREMYAKFVGDNRGPKRWIANHDELLTALRTAFPQSLVVEFPRKGMRSDVRLPGVFDMHHDADIIVAPHGAGLANMLFAKSDALQVIEVHQFRGRNTGPFYSLSKSIGICYQCIQNRNGGYTSEMIVDISQVADTVKKAMENIELIRKNGNHECAFFSRCYNGDKVLPTVDAFAKRKIAAAKKGLAESEG